MALYLIGVLAVFTQFSVNFHVKAEFALNFDSDESCASAVNGAQSIEGTDVVINAMRKGWWNCAEALAGNTNAEDLHSVVALESRTISSRIGSFKSAIEALRKPSQLITPAFQWAQSPDSIFLNVKFSHKLDAPATLDVVLDEVTLLPNSLTIKGSKDKKLFALDLTFFNEIDTEQSSWTTGSVGRIVFTIKKKGEDSKWPTLFPAGVPKLPQMHLWWDRQEEFQEQLDNFTDEDDDEDDIRMKQKKKQKKEKESNKKEGGNKKLTKKQKAQAKKSELEAKKLLQESSSSSVLSKNMPTYAIKAMNEIEEERKKSVESIEEDNRKKKEEIEEEYRLKREEMDKEFNALKQQIEQETEAKRLLLKQEYNLLDQNKEGDGKVWSDAVAAILKSVQGTVLSMDQPGELLSKAATHLPNLEILNPSQESELNHDALFMKGRVSLTHGVSEEHKVDAIWVMDEVTHDIIAFTDTLLTTNPPELVFHIPKQVKTLKAFAHCNLHGVWSSEVVSLSTPSDEL